MVEQPILDHVAIAVRQWSDGFDLLVHTLGGLWTRGGDAGDFAPGQLSFEHDMKVELLEPGRDVDDGFVVRFLERHGPGPHHLTFKVPDIDQFNRGSLALGLDPIPGKLDLPNRRETFLHPRQTGWGTLLQAIEEDDAYSGRTPPPDGFPLPSVPQHAVLWVAVVVPEVSAAVTLLTRVLDGTVVALDLAPSGGWALVEWTPGRRLLLASPGAIDAKRGGVPKVGVDHLLVGPPGSEAPDPAGALARALPPAPTTLGVPVAHWSATGDLVGVVE